MESHTTNTPLNTWKKVMNTPVMKNTRNERKNKISWKIFCLNRPAETEPTGFPAELPKKINNAIWKGYLMFTVMLTLKWFRDESIFLFYYYYFILFAANPHVMSHGSTYSLFDIIYITHNWKFGSYIILQT